MDKDNIESLVKKAKLADKGAIENLYNAFLPYICITISKIYIQGYDRNDLKQECFITLCNCIDKYKGSDTFIAYATTSIKNNLNHLLRKTLSHKEEINDNIVYTSINDYNLENTVIKRINIDTMSRAIKNLSASEKQILNNYYLNDLSLMTISKELDLKYITTVKKKDRALDKLKYYFKDE